MDGTAIEQDMDDLWGPESYLDAFRRGEVRTDVPFADIAERTRLGLDIFDEVWDGVLHMNAQPFDEHQRIGARLLAALLPVTDDAGLELRYELALIPPGELGWRNFRAPDLIVFAPEDGTVRGATGAELVVEIRSPRDESFAKLAYYEQLGVGEVLIIDRDTKAVRRWTLVDGHLTEMPTDTDGLHRLTCLPVGLRTVDEQLVVNIDGRDTRI